jgi:hypothetical protein
MIRIKCPKCATPLGIPDTQAGSAAACPKCGQKFRVPTLAAKPSDPSQPDAISRPRADRVQEEASSPKPSRKQVAVEEITPAPAAKRSQLRPSRPADQRAEDEDEADGRELEDEERIPRPKKRKKKKKKKEAKGPSGAHIAMVVGGVLTVAAVTGVLFLILRGSAKTEIDPAPVLAELQRIRAHIERDQNSPDKPVVGINLMGCEFKGELLKNLAVFPQLHRLNLGGTLTSDVKLEWLEDLTTLRVLNLGRTKVTGGGMQFLKKLVNLEELDLTQTLVDDVRLMELKGLTKLKKIYLDGTLASGLGLKEAIPGLEIIR